MQLSQIILATLLILTSTGIIAQQRKSANSAAKSKIVFSDNPQSTLQITEERNGEGDTVMTLKSKEIHYQRISICDSSVNKFFGFAQPEKNCENYIAKFTTNVTEYQGGETPDKNIKVELFASDKPHHTPLVLKRKCDELILQDNLYRTVIYGCCGGDDDDFYYDYQNKLIINGNNKILKVLPPNKQKFAFYTSYKDTYY